MKLDINFARLNHILLPDTKAKRDRFRQGFWGKALTPFTWLYEALTREGRALLTASLVVGFFAIDVQGTDAFFVWSAIIGLLLGSLIVRRAYRLPGVTIDVVAPRRVTAGDDLRFAIHLRNEGPRDALAVRIGGPFLPWDGRWTGPAPAVQHLRKSTETRVEIAARFTARGEHHLDAFGASALIPLGLTAGKAIWSRGVKFLVLPKIANVVRVTSAIGRRHQPGGVALASKTGESMDLLGVRPYRPGDPIKHLHAKSWARAGVPVVREYQEEYFSRIGVIVDTAPTAERKLEACLSLAAGVVARLSRGEALIDLLIVGGELHDLTIGRHLGFLEQALDLLACVEPDKKAVTNEALLARLAPHIARLSCVILITAAPDTARGSRLSTIGLRASKPGLAPPAASHGARHELADRIRGFGAGCTTLIVSGEGTPTPPVADRDTRVIHVDAIERGEALSL